MSEENLDQAPQSFAGVVVLIADDTPDNAGHRHPGVESIKFPFSYVNVVWRNGREVKDHMGTARLYAGETEIGGKKVPAVLANISINHLPAGQIWSSQQVENFSVSAIPGLEGQILESQELEDKTRRLTRVKLTGLSLDVNNVDKRIQPIKIQLPVKIETSEDK